METNNNKKIVRRFFKLLHFFNSGIFVISSAYIFVYALHKVGKSWLFIASLSSYSTMIIIFFLSFYLFAVYRGISSGQNVKDEHPLTTSLPYLLFYNISSLYGVFAVWLVSVSIYTTADYFLRISIGAVASTFLMWIIIDPLVGLSEMLLPSSRMHRHVRNLQTQELRKKDIEEKQNILNEINRSGQNDRRIWQQMLESDANELARIISKRNINYKNIESRVVEIGVKAFRLGGVECMRHLYFMTKQICERNAQFSLNLDYISFWWDGIGNWRCKWLEIELMQ